MKKVFFLGWMLFTISLISAQEKVKLTINFKCINGNKGFEYPSKLVVEQNGVKLGESKELMQTEKNTVTVLVNKGKSAIKATLYAKYEDSWEARTKANGYSIDWIYEKTANWQQNTTINLIFDINNLKIDDGTNSSEFTNSSSSTTTKSNTTVSSNYKDALTKVNTYLKTFDAGYYGYLEIVDGYLYDRFKSGKYCKTPINELASARVETPNRKVVIDCKSDKSCVFSTYTDSYHKQMSFSQSTDFNTNELVNLLNNLIATYNKPSSSTTSTTNSSTTNNTSTTKSAAEIRRDEMNRNNSNTTNTPTENFTSNSSKYTPALTKLNDYLKQFNSSVYKPIKVENGTVYFPFIVYSKEYYSSISIKELVQNTTVTKVNLISSEEVKIMCKNESNCFYSSYLNEDSDHFRFYSNTVKDLTKIEQLVKDFINALK